MNKKTLLLTIILFSSVVASWWLLDRHYSTPLSSHAAVSNTPDNFMIQATYVRFDKSGQIVNQLHSPKILHYPDRDSAKLEHPKLTAKTKNQFTWIITGEQGTSIDGGKEIQIKDNVKIQRTDIKTQKSSILNTSEMTAYPDKELAITHEPVTIIQPGSIINAVGLTADLKTGDIKLLSQARGVYNVQAQP